MEILNNKYSSPYFVLMEKEKMRKKFLFLISHERGNQIDTELSVQNPLRYCYPKQNGRDDKKGGSLWNMLMKQTDIRTPVNSTLFSSPSYGWCPHPQWWPTEGENSRISFLLCFPLRRCIQEIETKISSSFFFHFEIV